MNLNWLANNTMSRIIALAVIFTALGATTTALPQAAGPIDGGSFADLSLKALLSVPAQDRRGARSMAAEQIRFLPRSAQISAANVFFAKLHTEDVRNRNDILAVLGAIPSHWETSNTETDSEFIYNMLIASTDDTMKISLDNALSNAKGLYKDAISQFNTTSVSEIAASAPKLKAMGQKFPKSKYGERAGFYFSQGYSKRFLLKDTEGGRLMNLSNSAYEEFITRAEKGEFGNAPEYLAGAYFYRGVNGWISVNIADARKWLSMGQAKFNDNDVVYVYQVLVSTDRSAVIDQYLPAKSLFSKTLTFINQVPTPSIDRSSELTMIIRQ